MDLERDKCFFHYTTRDAAFGHIVPGGQLRFSRYLDMRDPLENKSWRFVGGAWGETTELQEQEQAAAYFRFDRIAGVIRRRSFLLSLTIDASPEETEEEDPFCRGWARARMWEQYAENHAGVCLVFDRQDLTAAVVASFLHQDLRALWHQPVLYEGAGMLKPILNLQELAGNVTPERVVDYVETNHEALFFHKAMDWQTEHEYRFCTMGRDETELFIDWGESLVAVIVGEKFPRWQRPAALAACSEVGVPALRLDWERGEPALQPLRPGRTRREEIKENIERNSGAAPPSAPLGEPERPTR